MIPAVLRNGAVQDAVHIAGNGGHGGFQLMGHIGHKFLALVFAFLQGGCHVVEGQSQLLHLFGVAFLHLDSRLQIAVAEGGSGARHVP